MQKLGRNPLFIRSYILTVLTNDLFAAARPNVSQSLIHQVLYSHLKVVMDKEVTQLKPQSLIHQVLYSHLGPLFLLPLQLQVAIPYSSGLIFSHDLSRDNGPCISYKVAIPYSSGLIFSPERYFGIYLFIRG